MADTRIKEKKIVCLGGGVGTVNMLRGLKAYTTDITTIISMADNGGSSGRLRRLYNVLPAGDMVSCMSVMSRQGDLTQKLLTYRFPGERYGDDHELGGQKLGNLVMVALQELTGSFAGAITKFQELFDVEGTFIPATANHVDISAVTVEGKEIFGEETIDLGKYEGKRILEKVILHPSDAKATPAAIEQILSADVILCGPG
ncbi:MAG: YvcK family protein, partial [Patescibacteria group bacterium]|nr:YvcK family protein [Patescibacteria group bacterium]